MARESVSGETSRTRPANKRSRSVDAKHFRVLRTVRSHLSAFVDIQTARFSDVRFPPPLLADASKAELVVSLNTSSMPASFTLGHLKTVDLLAVTILPFPLIRAKTSERNSSENLSTKTNNSLTGKIRGDG